jgi:hypothetical protein
LQGILHDADFVNGKRYNHVLEAVVTYTEELAYKQAKEADDLLSQGTYLGIFL